MIVVLKINFFVKTFCIKISVHRAYNAYQDSDCGTHCYIFYKEYGYSCSDQKEYSFDWLSNIELSNPCNK